MVALLPVAAQCLLMFCSTSENASLFLLELVSLAQLCYGFKSP